MSFFDAAFEIVVGVEAGYVNDPKDPGGETKFGISKRAYPDEDIANLTLERAKELYRRDRWDFCHCEGMSWEMALCVFDAAVNQGQNYARLLPADPVELMAQRALRYQKNPLFADYGHGWMRRLFNICRQAQRTPSGV